MDIYHVLMRDHRKVSALFKKVMVTHNADLRLDLFEKILLELSIHAATEQATFYNALNKNKKGKEEISHAEEEHREIKTCLNKIANSNYKSDDWLIHFGELKSIVEHHVKEEETEIFKIAKKMISKREANMLGLKMLALKKEMLNQVNQSLRLAA